MCKSSCASPGITPIFTDSSPDFILSHLIKSQHLWDFCISQLSEKCLQSSWKNNQFWHWHPKRPDSISVWYINDTLAEVDKRWFNHRSPAVISFLPVIPVVQGRPLCSNSLCLTSSDDRILLIHSTWSGLLVPRGINTRSITSNQTLITFSALIAIGWHVTCYCKACLVSIDSNDQTMEADIFFLRRISHCHQDKLHARSQPRATCSLKLTRLVLGFCQLLVRIV